MTTIFRFFSSFTTSPRIANTLLFIMMLLVFNIDVFGAQAIYRHTSNDLVALGETPAFRDVIQIIVYRKNGEKASCSAARVKIANLATPIFVTAAHCLEKAELVLTVCMI